MSNLSAGSIPQQVKTATQAEIDAADWLFHREDAGGIAKVKGTPMLTLPEHHIETTAIILDRREANAKDPLEREAMKRRRAALVLALGLQLKGPHDATRKTCRYQLAGLPQVTDDDGNPVRLLDLEKLQTAILGHMQAERAAQAAGDTDEAHHEHECVDALACIAGSCGVSLNLAKWWSESGRPHPDGAVN